ncbi:UDP-glucose 4-epimerase [Corynebacterium atrinae]|uniref:NAD-dependent epimerase/dehydratase family protein n=1 Tax=Corynebacterium atrinae TaxID=1336740 RepID=UPI0025B2F0AC|nr:NAD-dependent epimerase/dehydratase family protein [Corynebacterium atrinae]WJY64518.1 UDP-glucose 4-epimerase [Corynebacterium atrinae]
MSRIVITGGAGFIGSNLARLALESGHSVVVVDDLSTGEKANLEGLDLDFVEMSILDEEELVPVFQGADSIVHLAAMGSVPRSIQDPHRTNDVNINGTLAVLQAARRADVNHLVFSSSSSVYGRNPALPKHEREWVRAMSPYAVTKLAGEQYVLAHQESYGMETLAFRFFNVFGPRQSVGHAYAAVIPRFLDAIIQGQPVTIYGDGTQSRSFTYVGTVCSVLLDAVERRVSHPEPVNLAFDTRTDLHGILTELESLVGSPVERIYEDPRPGDVKHSQAANSSLLTLFPQVKEKDLREGLAETLAWYKSQ